MGEVVTCVFARGPSGEEALAARWAVSKFLFAKWAGLSSRECRTGSSEGCGSVDISGRILLLRAIAGSRTAIAIPAAGAWGGDEDKNS